MGTVVDIVQWVVTGLFLLLGVVALRAWVTSRSRDRLLIAGAMISIGAIGLIGRINELSGYRSRWLVDASVLAIVGSSFTFMEFRHTVIPLSQRWRRAALAATFTLLGLGLASHFPPGKAPVLSPAQNLVAFGIIGWWLLSMLEPAIRFRTAARARPPIERARLRMLAAGYLGIVVILVLGIAFDSKERVALQLGLQVVALVLVPVFFFAVAPPAWLRRSLVARETERERARLLLTFPAVVWSVDRDLRLLSFDGGGIPPEVDPALWRGKTLVEFLAAHGDEDGEAASPVLEAHRCALMGKTATYDVPLLGRVYQCRVETIFGPDGHIDGAIGFAVDITERTRAENALMTALEVERKAADQLRALDEMKNAFLTAVSHELRTPLTSVIGFSATLQREHLIAPEERAMIISRLVASAERLQALLSDLLDLDRLRRGIAEPVKDAVDVGDLVRRMAESWSSESGRFVDLDCAPIIAAVDGAKVERIVDNLLVNAGKYTPPDAQIWVRTEPFDQGVLIVVEDDGPGIPAEISEAIFEPFRQGRNISHAPGVGIGLSLVSSFSEMHSGRAWVEERPGGGASFHVWLPLALSEAVRISA